MPVSGRGNPAPAGRLPPRALARSRAPGRGVPWALRRRRASVRPASSGGAARCTTWSVTRSLCSIATRSVARSAAKAVRPSTSVLAALCSRRLTHQYPSERALVRFTWPDSNALEAGHVDDLRRRLPGTLRVIRNDAGCAGRDCRFAAARFRGNAVVMRAALQRTVWEQPPNCDAAEVLLTLTPEFYHPLPARGLSGGSRASHRPARAGTGPARHTPCDRPQGAWRCLGAGLRARPRRSLPCRQRTAGGSNSSRT